MGIRAAASAVRWIWTHSCLLPKVLLLLGFRPQIAGAVLTVGSVTVYMGFQYYQSRRQAAQQASQPSLPASEAPAAKAGGAEPCDAA